MKKTYKDLLSTLVVLIFLWERQIVHTIRQKTKYYVCQASPAYATMAKIDNPQSLVLKILFLDYVTCSLTGSWNLSPVVIFLIWGPRMTKVPHSGNTPGARGGGQREWQKPHQASAQNEHMSQYLASGFRKDPCPGSGGSGEGPRMEKKEGIKHLEAVPVTDSNRTC